MIAGTGTPDREATLPHAGSALPHELVRWVGLGLQLRLILALAWAFQIESPASYLRILPLAVGGALITEIQEYQDA